MRIFVAGAGGVIGRHLLPLLAADGHQVTASTRSPAKTGLLRELGAAPVVLDGLDAAAVGEAVARAQPEVVIHQMTSLAGATSMRRFDRAFAVTNRLRTEGTDHLLAAAAAAGARRFLAQSFTGWPNIRQGSPVKTEEDPLDPAPPAAQQQSLAAIRHLEQAVLAAPLAGIVLRYGLLYGPGTSDELTGLVRKGRLPIIGDGGGTWSFIQVADAASATAAAVRRGSPGLYNVADDEPATAAEWLPVLAEAAGARPPRRIPVWLGRLAAGEVGVSMMTQIRGSSNARAKRELCWRPAWPSWRQGFRDWIAAAGRAAA